MSPKPPNGSACGTFTTWTVGMLTTEGFTYSTSVAMSGVPGRTGGVAKGAWACGASGGEAAEAECWQPVPRDRASAVKGRSFRSDMPPYNNPRAWRFPGAVR